jgi:hypothetical protein
MVTNCFGLAFAISRTVHPGVEYLEPPTVIRLRTPVYLLSATRGRVRVEKGDLLKVFPGTGKWYSVQKRVTEPEGLAIG